MFVQANPADVYMDIITGLVGPCSATGTRTSPADLASLWVAHCAAQRCAGTGPLAANEVGQRCWLL